MKRIFVLLVTLSMLLVMSVTASANEHRGDEHRRDNRHHEEQRRHHNDNHWQRTHHSDRSYEQHMPFQWHTGFHSIHNRHQMQRIHHGGWDDRFPGLHAYRSQGHGFWHHGRYVEDAVFFFNSSDELVSIGYMHNGVFIRMNSDHEVHESRDSFFLSWWNN